MIPPHTNRYPKPPSGAATGWGRFFCVLDGGSGRRREVRQSPSGLAGSASSPHSEEPFARAKPAGGASLVKDRLPRAGGRWRVAPEGELVPSASEAEGFLAVCGYDGQSGKARRNPPVRWRSQPFGPGPLCRSATSPRAAGSHPLTRGPFLRGRSPREKPPLTGEVAERQRWPEGLLRFATAGSCGGVKTPPYGAKDTWAVMARLRAGHARPLRGGVDGVRTRGAREGGSPPLPSWRELPGNGWRRKARRNPPGR